MNKRRKYKKRDMKEVREGRRDLINMMGKENIKNMKKYGSVSKREKRKWDSYNNKYT